MIGPWAHGSVGLWAFEKLEKKRGNKVGLHQDFLPQHGVLQHHGIQGHNGGPHVPLSCGLRPNDYASTLRRLFEIQEALSTAAGAHVVVWYTMMTLNPILLEDTLMVFDFIVM